MLDDELKQGYIAQFGLEKPFCSALLEHIRLYQFDKGEFLYHQGDKQEYLYCLLKGKLQVDFFQEDGSFAVFAFESAFSMIGDLELIDTEKEVGNVVCISDCILFVIPIKAVHDYSIRDPDFLQFLLLQVGKKFSESSVLHSQSNLSVESKLSRYLQFRYEREGTSIELEKRDSVASMLGVSVRQLNRTLKDFNEREIIHYKNRSLTLLQPDKLYSLNYQGE